MKFIFLCLSQNLINAKKNKDSVTISGNESSDQLDGILTQMSDLWTLGPSLGSEQKSIKYNVLQIQLFWLNENQLLSNYYNYGCHCLQSSKSGLNSGGYGKPLGKSL